MEQRGNGRVGAALVATSPSASSSPVEPFTAVHAIGASRAAHPRVLLRRASPGMDPLVHDHAATRTEANRHHRAPVIVIGAAHSLHFSGSFSDTSSPAARTLQPARPVRARLRQGHGSKGTPRDFSSSPSPPGASARSFDASSDMRICILDSLMLCTWKIEAPSARSSHAPLPKIARDGELTCGTVCVRCSGASGGARRGRRPAPDRRGARARFWSEVREVQREAEADSRR